MNLGFLVSFSAIILAGAIPRLVDISEDYLIDVSKIKHAITAKTKAIIPVHLYGQSCDMDRVIEIAKKYKLKIIEDCAQAQGAKYKKKFVGTFGSMGCFSFYPTKILGAYGDGGAILTNNYNHYLKAKRIRFYGIETVTKNNKFFKKKTINFINVARLDNQKDHITLLKAFVKLKNKISVMNEMG